MIHTPDSDDDNEYGKSQLRGNPGVHNSQLAVGYKNNRSFVVRGDKIGVFKHTDDDQLEFSAAINNVSTLGGQYFSPRKVMLHEQDSSMLIMKPGETQKVFKMDLERGKIVEEYKVDDVMSVDDIVPDSKYAQMSANKVSSVFSPNFVDVYWHQWKLHLPGRPSLVGKQAC